MTMALTYKSTFYYCKTYPVCASAFIFAALGCVSLIISVSSPFWLVSKVETHSEFVRLGLWNICFKRYHHPALPHILDGCHPLHRHRYEEMRKWLQPAWFILVQCLVICSTFLSALCVCLLGYMMFQSELEIKIFVAAFVFVFEAISAFMTFLSACLFGVMSFERSWINHPSLNSLSWGFGFCVTASVLLLFTAACLLKQTLNLRQLLARDHRVYHIPLSNKTRSC